MKLWSTLKVFKNVWSLSLGTGKDIKSSARIQEEEKCECFQLYIANESSRESVNSRHVLH